MHVLPVVRKVVGEQLGGVGDVGYRDEFGERAIKGK